MDSNAALIGQYVYGATACWHTNICCINNTADDLFHRTIANALATWFSDGHTKGCAYGQFDGQSWHIGKASAENYDRSSAYLSFWLHDVLLGWHGGSSVFLLCFGMLGFCSHLNYFVTFQWTSIIPHFHLILSPALRCCLSRRNVTECHPIGDSKRSIDHIHSCVGLDPCLPLLNHWLCIFQRRFLSARRR